ncbi:hypothetical protein [Synechococcus phage MinM1]|nr:hypothetical protein [Synechococcus phage MinM1]
MEGGWIRTGQWQGRDVLWWRNPRHLLPAAWLRVVALWRMSQGGMARGWLPGAGGLNDQPAWLVDAFGILSAEEHRMDQRRQEAG